MDLEVGGVRTGSPWRYMPHTLPPPWEAPYQQRQRWIKAGLFEEVLHDLRVLFLRLSEGRAPEPTAAILDSPTPCVLPRRAALGAATRWGQAQEGLQDARGGGRFGGFARPACKPSRRAKDSGLVEEEAEAIQEATAESVELASYVDL
jgi:transposase